MVASCHAHNPDLKDSAKVVGQHYPIGGVRNAMRVVEKRDERRDLHRCYDGN